MELAKEYLKASSRHSI